MIVAFTGHRPAKLGGYGHVNPTRDRIVKKLLDKLRELKPEKAISGVAQGVDQWAAECCHFLQIYWIAAVPFEGQELVWPERHQKYYRGLLKRANEVHVVSDGKDKVADMQTRNEWMVDRCDVLIAVWDGSPGGTANCVRYAKLMGKQIVYIDPHA